VTFRIRIFALGAFLSAGILLAAQTQPGPIPSLVAGVLAAALLLAACLRHRQLPDAQPTELLPRLAAGTGVLLLVGVAAIGFSEMGLKQAVLSRAGSALRDGEELVVRGRLVDDPESDPPSTRFTIGSMTVGDRRMTGRLRVRSYGRSPALALGDRVELGGRARRLDRADPFDAILFRGGVVAKLTTDSSRLKVLSHSSNPAVRASNLFRTRMNQAALRVLSRDRAALVMGLVVGDERDIPKQITDDFRAAGLSHITAVSGANLAMVLGALVLVMRALKLSRRATIGCSLGMTALFVVVARAQPSVLRASVMAVLALAAFFFGRKSDPAHALGLAFVALVAFDPMLLWSIGFQLSFAAAAGIVFLSPLIGNHLARLPRWLAEPAGVTLAAQLAVFPLIALHFGRIGLLALPANLIAFPLVAPATVLGLAGGLASLVSMQVGAVFMEVAGVFVSILKVVAHLFGGSPRAEVSSPHFAFGEALAAYLAIAALMMVLAGRGRSARWPGVLALVALLAANLLPVASARGPAGLRVTFFDVGEGDAALVESASGARILIDGGRDPMLVASNLARRGYQRLDLVAASHLHADHVTGLIEVLRKFQVAVAVHPGINAPLLADLQRSRPLEEAADGEQLQVGDVLLEFLGPDRQMNEVASQAVALPGSATEGSPLNDASIVLKVSWRNQCVLFTGDIEEAGQQELMNDHPDQIACAVLKAPHHGSGKLLKAFVEAVAPSWVAISVGPNDYGHPSPKALGMFVAARAQVLRTDRLGDVVLEIDTGGGIRLAG
jgi:competence protein ComEC